MEKIYIRKAKPAKPLEQVSVTVHAERHEKHILALAGKEKCVAPIKSEPARTLKSLCREISNSYKMDKPCEVYQSRKGERYSLKLAKTVKPLEPCVFYFYFFLIFNLNIF